MGLSIKVTHDVNLTCDHVGCAKSNNRTWMPDVADALNEARAKGWWIGMDPTVYGDAQANSNKPTLVFCPDHVVEAPAHKAQEEPA